MSNESILEVKDLQVGFNVEGRELIAVAGSSFKVPKGKTLGIVGESGCGKSVTAYSAMRLIPNPPGEIKSGQIIYHGDEESVDILKINIEEMRKIRGKEISMIFQEPMTALNPVYTIGHQLAEVFKMHFNYSATEIQRRCEESLHQVGIPSARQRLKDYPHQLSGGMRQRVMIAMALSCSPKILIADEPTTALDVTIQAQILDLMNKLKDELNTSIIFITHDLGVVAEMCDEVVVMYAGQIIEKGSVFDIYERPLHPYSKGLLESIPKRGLSKEQKLPTIEGMVPDLFNLPVGCRFADRCSNAQALCKEQNPELTNIDSDREVACHFPLN